MRYKWNNKLIFMFFLGMGAIAPLVDGQRRQGKSALGMEAKENTYMQYTDQWKKEIISWATECVLDINNKMTQLDQLFWELDPDLRYQLGVLMGRIFELHRQQVDMYRRIKNRIENKFAWIKEDLAAKYRNPDGSPYVDYKPHIYITALEYVTKKESDIEHLVRMTTTYLLEDEVGNYQPNMLPISENIKKEWTKFTTSRPQLPPNYQGRKGPDSEDIMAQKEKEVKAKMRQEYYRKRHNNDNK